MVNLLLEIFIKSKQKYLCKIEIDETAQIELLNLDNDTWDLFNCVQLINHIYTRSIFKRSLTGLNSEFSVF